MARTWILVAHRAGARLFESDGPAAELRLVEEVEHALGRAHDRDIDADRPGSVTDSSRRGGRAYVRENSATETTTQAFARRLVAALEDARKAHRFERLVLVAPPRFLGRLRGALPGPLEPLVAATLAKDLPDASAAAVRAHLADVALV